MNTTTTTTTAGSTISMTTMSIADQLYLHFKNPVFIIRFYQIAYSFTFLCGFIGNTASLFTFSRPTLRKVSTGCLFICLATSDMLYLFTIIFDIVEFGIQIPFYRHVAYAELCQFRAFVSNVAQFSSAWILVIVSLDRWIRTRFPFKSGSICTPKKALMAVAVILVIDVGLNSHILTSMFGALAPGFAILACGPNFSSVPYFYFYYLYWSVVQIFTTCLVPALLMLVILIDIFISVRKRKQTVIQPVQPQRDDKNIKRQKALQKQMFILMLASICIFLITSLPLALYKILTPRAVEFAASIYNVISIWTAIAWFQSLFYAIGFYIHCLSSTLFRKEFKQLISCIWGVNQTPVSAFTISKLDQRVHINHISKRV